MSISKRIDAITGISPEYRHIRLPAPRSVKIELTANCQYRCGFCVKSLRPDNGEMDRGFYSQIIRDMRECGVEELGLFYIGESFLCSWLPDAIKEAKEVGFPYVFLTTNGSVANPDKVEACMRAGLDSLKFSLNFHSPQQLKEVAQVSGRHWQKAIDNLKEACRIRDEGGYPCKVYASSIAFNGEQGAKMQEVIDDVLPMLDEHYFLPLYGMSGASVNIGWKPKPGNPGRLDNMREPLPCWSVFTEGHVTKDGKMVACCFGTGLDNDMVMGDLMKDDFMTCWNSKAYQRLREAHLNEDVTDTPCASCAAGS